MSYQPLRLLARSQEDLQVVSACLQDAVLKQKDMAFLKESGFFVLMGNRFVWEQYFEDKTDCLRVRCGLRFQNVKKVQSRGFNSARGEAVQSVLAITYELASDSQSPIDDAVLHHVRIIFSGDCEIRLDVEDCEAILEDIGSPWRAKRVPQHEV